MVMANASTRRVLLEHCCAGNLNELQNWAAVCGLTAEDARANKNEALLMRSTPLP
jgi:hypothetical protein